MASSPVKLLLGLLAFCIVGWIVFMFAARLLAWLLSRLLGASVGFKVAGCNCLRDLSLKFKKGPVESISIGEIKLSLRKSLVKLGVGFISKDPKLQLLICDLEITTRSSERRIKKSTSKKAQSAGRGKWMLLANIARFISVSVLDMVVKTPKAIIEVKDLGLDTSKNGGSNPTLNVKLRLVPFLLYIGSSRFNFDQLGGLVDGQSCSLTAERNLAPIICDELLITCGFIHNREIGIGIRNFDVVSGDVTAKLEEDLFSKTVNTSETSSTAEVVLDPTDSTRSLKDKNSLVSLKKHILVFPEEVSFSLPKLCMTIGHRGQDFTVENNIMGIHLESSKSTLYDDTGEATSHFDMQMDFSEIHLMRECSTSVLEILKVVILASIDVPKQPDNSIRSEIDVKLGGTQCNLIFSRLTPLLRLQQLKQKKMILKDESQCQEKYQETESKSVLWTCTVSAPEMTVALYSIKGLPLYHGCSQSSHLFANNIAGKGMQVHAELGELQLHTANEQQESFRESLFGVETNAGSLAHIARVSLDWGHKEMESHEENNIKWKMVFSVDVSGMGMYFNFQQIESLLAAAMSYKVLIKKFSIGKKTVQRKASKSSKNSPRGTQIFKINLERCSIVFSNDVGVEDAVVPDPKRVNFGSQGGEVMISVSADGTPRQACISSTISSDKKILKNSTALDISHLSLCLNKEKKSTRMELERARSVYKEYNEEHSLVTEVTIFDMQNAKFVRRPGGPNETSICSLFSATDIAARLEPDVYLSLYEVVLRLKYILHNLKIKSSGNEGTEEHRKKSLELESEANTDSFPSEMQNKRKDSIFAVDVELLRLSAELADGVEALIHVQSIFSENAKIGILLEGFFLSFNGARVFKSSRMQISRLPIFSSTNLIDVKEPAAIKWDWVIQGLDIHICMPYRLQLRAIEDAIEDTWRGLKLLTAAKTSKFYPVMKERPKKVKTRSSKFGSVKFNIRKLTAAIEEEPIQGWLDEHYQLMKSEICELAARLKFLDDLVSEICKSSRVEQKESSSVKKIQHDGIDIDIHDLSDIQRLREEIHQKSFRSYYLACQKLQHAEGSGAYSSGFQSGFHSSTTRASLLSVCATELDVTLTKIEGDDIGMIEFIRKVDSVASDNDIPFSRLYGRDLVLHAGSLVAQLRNYTLPLFSGTVGRCEGRVVLAQQATCFQPQIKQDVYIGRWRKVCMLRSASGTTPPMKMYSDLPIDFQKGEICFGVGFEPAFADISYAFTVALRRADLSRRASQINSNNVPTADFSGHSNSMPLKNQPPPKKERSLPWWDDVRYYIHAKIGICFMETRWNILGTTNPYEMLDKLQIVSGYMDIHHTDGHVSVSAKEFKIFISSFESLLQSCTLKHPPRVSTPFIDTSSFSLEVVMDWECESGNPLNHYLHALPNEGEPREKVYDPFRSTSLSLRWDFSLKPTLISSDNQRTAADLTDMGLINESFHGNSKKLESSIDDYVGLPTMNLGAHDLIWIFKCWNMLYNPPHKLRSFSRWPRFGIPRATRSGNLSLDKVMTEFFIRLDSTPTCIKHMTLGDDDPASGLTFRMNKLKYELCYSRGKQQYTFDCKREPLDLVYQGLDLHILKAFLNRDSSSINLYNQTMNKCWQPTPSDKVSNDKLSYMCGLIDRNKDDGFLMCSDYFTIRKQAPKADPARLLAWQDTGRKHIEMTYVRSEFENGSESDHTRSDPSDDDGFNVVIADNCQRVFVYGLKLLWTIENRDAVWSWVGGLAKAFEAPKPSPSRQYAQRKMIEERQKLDGSEISDVAQDESSMPLICISHGENSSPQFVESTVPNPTLSTSNKIEILSGASAKHSGADDEEEGTRHFMVNVIQPQFNLHSEDANGRFLLAAASGRVLARSFHSVLHVGYKMIEEALGTDKIKVPDCEPEMTWKRMEFSVMLQQVQAHVAPTDVDPGAGLQWLPKILRNSPKVKRTGALLERVFMPCQMYFRYTRHKGGTADLKMKPLKDLTFNSPNITATMTSRQFQVMLDVLTNLLFARLPKPRKNSLSFPTEDDEDVEEETDEVVPDGVEEVELARINLEQKERERKLLLDDIRSIMACDDSASPLGRRADKESDLWMITGSRSTLVQGLKKELLSIQKFRKAASICLRTALQKAAQLRLTEKEKNKSPSYAMRISMRIDKVGWSMLADGKSFAEAEINNMIYDFERDYKDIGIAQFTTKSFEVRNCLPHAKSDMLLSPWNAPPEWGKNVMLRVDAKQGAPKDGNSPLEHFQVEIYPLKIHLTETMYRMMWEYFFPEEEQDSHRRQEVWKVSTTAGSRRGRKSASGSADVALNYKSKESEAFARSSMTAGSSVTAEGSTHPDNSQGSKLHGPKANVMCGSSPELRRTSSFDKTWEENVAESVANEIVLQIHSSCYSSCKGVSLNPALENPRSLNEDTLKIRPKDPKPAKPGRLSNEEKRSSKSQDDKRARTRKMMEFHNIKISQVELLVTYEGSRFAVNDLRLLMDTFHRVDFTGTWRKLFSKVKKHIIWGVLKSVTGMQGKKFKDKAQSNRDSNGAAVPDIDLNFSDSDGGQPGKSDQFPLSWLKRPNDGAGDGFVTSIKGLFNSQRRRAKAFVLRTMRGEPDSELHADCSESDVEFAPFARQLTITKRLIRKHTKKFRSRGQKASGTTSRQRGSIPSSPRESSAIQSESSGGSSPYEDLHE